MLWDALLLWMPLSPTRNSIRGPHWTIPSRWQARDTRSEKREARSEKREARSEKREAKSEKREARETRLILRSFFLFKFVEMAKGFELGNWKNAQSSIIYSSSMRPVYSFFHWFIHSLICLEQFSLFFHSYIYNRPSLYSLLRPFIAQLIYSFIYSFIPLFIHSFIHSFIHPFTHSFIRSFFTFLISGILVALYHSCIPSWVIVS